jgi:hypothetical protein
MGFGDKLKGLKDQAQQAVAENKDKIQDAVQVAGQVANTKTHGKYATKIAKVGEKVETSVDKFAQGEDAEGAAGATATGATATGATPTDAPAAAVTHEPAAYSEPPAFEPHAEAAEAAPEAPAEKPSHSAPDFE